MDYALQLDNVTLVTQCNTWQCALGSKYLTVEYRLNSYTVEKT